MARLDPLLGLPRARKIVLAVIALVAMTVLGHVLLLAPGEAERRALLRKREALEAELAQARRDEASQRPFRDQVALLRIRLAEAVERLPSQREIPALYRRIADLAARSGMVVTLFAPRATEEHDIYSEVPISLAVEGAYHQLRLLLEQIGRLPRIVATRDMRLQRIERPTGSLRAELGLVTYTLRTDDMPRSGRASAPTAPPPASASGRAPAAAPEPPR